MGHFVAHVDFQVLLSHVVQEVAVKVEKLLLVLEVFHLLRPVRLHHLLVVTKNPIVELDGQGLFKLILRYNFRNQVAHFFLEVEFEDFLNHHGQVSLYCQHLRLQIVYFVAVLVDDKSLLFHLVQHFVFKQDFHAFHLQIKVNQSY